MGLVGAAFATTGQSPGRDSRSARPRFDLKAQRGRLTAGVRPNWRLQGNALIEGGAHRRNGKWRSLLLACNPKLGMIKDAIANVAGDRNLPNFSSHNRL